MTLDPPSHLGQALRRRGYLLSSWPWRALLYVVTALPAAVLCAVFVVIGAPMFAFVNAAHQGRRIPLVLIVLLTVTVLVILALTPLVSGVVAAVERWRLSIADQRPLPRQRLRGLKARYTSAAAWREVAYTFWLGSVVPIAYWLLALLIALDLTLIASPWLAGEADQIVVIWTTIDTPRQAIPYAIGGFLFLPVLVYLMSLLAAGQAAVARLLLGTPAGETALREVTRSRERLVDAYEAQRRRIERDVHDWVQPRLTSLTLQLGLARLDVPDGSPAVKPLEIAHEQAKGLMMVLRQIVHGIRPQSLTDLGLAGAVQELAAQATVPVTVHAALSRPVPERVETIAYSVVSEALANIAQHADARRAEVTLSQSDDHLVVEVRDDGRGGADPARGTGLTGLADRVAAVNGRLLLSSPATGSTLVRVELPCQP